jgi:hypothetical protein
VRTDTLGAQKGFEGHAPPTYEADIYEKATRLGGQPKGEEEVARMYVPSPSVGAQWRLPATARIDATRWRFVTHPMGVSQSDVCCIRICHVRLYRVCSCEER